MADYTSPIDLINAQANNPTEQLNKLAEMFQKGNLQKQAEDATLKKAQQEHMLKQQGASALLGQAKEYSQTHPDMGITLGPDSASITPKPDRSIFLKNALDEKHEQAVRRQAADYGKRLENKTGFSSALKDIEDLTNREGQGGILTNPQAQLVSAGKVMSAVPTGAIGLGEMLGVGPKGGAEERKALERLQLEYQKAMTGARTSDEMRKAERQAMGWVQSGDPTLVQKGVRSLARNVKQHLDTIKGSFDPEVQQRIHEQIGDPTEFLSSLSPEEALPKIRSKNHSQQPQAQPQAQPQGGQMSFDEFKRRKAAGQL